MICIVPKNIQNDHGMKLKLEIDMMAKQMPETRRIFLADGDALNLRFTEYMIKIVKYIKEKFPNYGENFMLCNANEYSKENVLKS